MKNFYQLCEAVGRQKFRIYTYSLRDIPLEQHDAYFTDDDIRIMLDQLEEKNLIVPVTSPAGNVTVSFGRSVIEFETRLGAKTLGGWEATGGTFASRKNSLRLVLNSQTVNSLCQLLHCSAKKYSKPYEEEGMDYWHFITPQQIRAACNEVMTSPEMRKIGEVPLSGRGRTRRRVKLNNVVVSHQQQEGFSVLPNENNYYFHYEILFPVVENLLRPYNLQNGSYYIVDISR